VVNTLVYPFVRIAAIYHCGDGRKLVHLIECS